MTEVAVVMDGSRRHYDVPRALYRAGRLGRVFADWYAQPGSVEASAARLVGRARPTLGRRLGERVATELPPSLVRSNPALTVWMAAHRRHFRHAEDYWAWCSTETARWVRRVGWGDADGLFGYVRNVHPGLLRTARRAGLLTVGEQMIAPAAIELAEAEQQADMWQGWEPVPDRHTYGRVQRFEEATWAACNRVVTPSAYVRDGLIAQGVPAERMALVPYPAEVGPFTFIDRRGRTGPMTVGFVGQVNLRKNAPAVFAIARRFRPTEVRFVMVGKVFLTAAALAAHAGDVELTGPRPRSAVPELLSGFDVFLFPSTCEGSAGAVIEAMATGLPVLTTPNTGSPVRHGEDGFVLTPRNVDGFAGYIAELARDPERRHALGMSARQRVAGLTLDRYGRELAAVFDGIGR